MNNNFYSGHRGNRTVWVFGKNYANILPLPQNVCELHDRIRAVALKIGRNILKRIWQELDCRIDICRVMKGVYFEHL
jgi:hypothetical protein